MLTERVHTIIFHLSRELPKALIYPWKQCRGISSATKNLTTTPSFGWFFSRTYEYLSIEARDLSVHIVNFSNFSPAVSAKNRNQLSKESDEILCEMSLLGKRTTSKLSRCPLFTWAGANSKVTLWMKIVIFRWIWANPSNANAKA